MLLPIVPLIDYEPLLRNYALPLVRNEPDAADLVQETFLRALKAENKPFKANEYPPWLCTILHHCYLDRVRKTSRHPECSLDDSSLDAFVAPATNVTSDVVEFIISALPASRQPIIRLLLQDYTGPEIADTLHVPLGTVMSSVYHARRQMRRFVQEHL
ncbi:RNA polymerase sigma factor [Candidatus Woesearchaeota archaeon]|nr:RNA polymerase sigma factor [Candidatus Woesearchaeota archaeon]